MSPGQKPQVANRAFRATEHTISTACPMRISYFLPRCTPDNSHGRYVIELAKRLGREHQVTVHAGAFWPPLRSVVRCRLLPIPNRPAVARLASLWMASIIVNKRRPADIVHVQGADAPVGNVVTAHCCNAAMKAAVEGRGSLTRKLNYSIGVRVERYCFQKRSTRSVIAVSHKVSADIQKHYGVAPERIVVISHGVDAEAFHPVNGASSRSEVRDRLGLRPDTFVALFVGADYRLKGLLPLLQAAARVPAVRVLAVGVRPDSALLGLAQQQGLDRRVVFRDNTSEIASLYTAADCFVLPTRYDTFSLVTLEAMASGLPVIVSRAAGVSELLSPDGDSLVLEHADDVDTLARYLGRLVTDEVLRTNLGLQARKTAERYSWDDVAERTLAVYREALVDSP